MQFSVSNAELTQKIAEKLAKALHAGDVILLDGDLGAGKTTLIKLLGWRADSALGKTSKVRLSH